MKYRIMTAAAATCLIIIAYGCSKITTNSNPVTVSPDSIAKETSMKKILHKSTDRGHTAQGWLDTWYSFSFASWYNPARMGFGLLRVLNDDIIAPGMGFGMHPHRDMEIVTIPLEGTLAHKDNQGNSGTITAGEVQVMSAGSGIYHSEFNASKEKPVKLLQIWVETANKGVKPRYAQTTIGWDQNDQHDAGSSLISLVGPESGDAPLWINQDAWFTMGLLPNGGELTYFMNRPANVLYLFIIDGPVKAAAETLNERDALGLSGISELTISGAPGTRALFIEVPAS